MFLSPEFTPKRCVGQLEPSDNVPILCHYYTPPVLL